MGRDNGYCHRSGRPIPREEFPDRDSHVLLTTRYRSENNIPEKETHIEPRVRKRQNA